MRAGQDNRAKRIKQRIGLDLSSVLSVLTRFAERAQGVSLVKAFGGFADGCNEVNPDSEQNEPAKPQGLKVSFCERGANPRRIAPSAK